MENDEDWKPTIHPMIPNVPHTNPTQLESQDQPITSESYGNLSPCNYIYIYIQFTSTHSFFSHVSDTNLHELHFDRTPMPFLWLLESMAATATHGRLWPLGIKNH